MSLLFSPPLPLPRYADHKRYSEYSRAAPIPGGSSTPGSSSSRDYHRDRDRDRDRGREPRRERDRERERDRYGAPLPPGAYYGPPVNGAELAYRYPMPEYTRSEREYMDYRRSEYDRRPPPSANS